MDGGAVRKVCIVTASEMTVRAFLLDHIAALSEHYDVSLVVNAAETDGPSRLDVSAEVIPVRIERAISPAADLRALFRLTGIFRRRGFDAVHSITPKAGLLAMLASRTAGVPVRVHTFTGQVWATRTGPGRQLLRSLDRVIAETATDVLVDSASQRDFLVEQGVLRTGRGAVLAGGSVSGVDASRFRPDARARSEIRALHAIPPDATVILFLGRLNRDKGVLELAEAFARVAREDPAAHLLVVGPDEAGLRPAVVNGLGEYASRARFQGFTDAPEKYMAAADLLALPSYREGFGSVIVEAAAVGLPAVGTRIYGLTDAVVDGTTGLLCAVRSASALADALGRLVRDPELRRTMGASARARALRDFSRERLTGALVEFYARRVPPARSRAAGAP